MNYRFNQNTSVFLTTTNDPPEGHWEDIQTALGSTLSRGSKI